MTSRKDGSHVVNNSTGQAGKLRRVIEPPFPVHDMVNRSDKCCVTAPLLKRLNSGQGSVAYIIIDGCQATIAIVTGRNKKILYDESVILPRKHGKGDQSADRSGRIRQQSRQLYIKKVADIAKQLLMNNNNPSVNALVVAGSGYLKDDFVSALNPSLKRILKKVEAITHRGKNGLNEAIEITRNLLSEMKLDDTKKHLEKFFKHLQMGEDDMISYGEQNVRTAIEAGVVSHVVVCAKSNIVMWLKKNCPKFNTEIHIFKNSINETKMLVNSFGGVCAFHRHSFEVQVEEGEEIEEVIDN